MKYTCTKLFNNLPAAHRQHNHDGHCALIHGHNWAFEFTFFATRLDENGFVVDFGKLKFIKEWLEDKFDHTLLLNKDDPHLGYLQKVLSDTPEPLSLCGFAKIVVVENCGAEKLAEWVCKEVERLIAECLPDGGRIHVEKVTCFEDSKNAATFTW